MPATFPTILIRSTFHRPMLQAKMRAEGNAPCLEFPAQGCCVPARVLIISNMSSDQNPVFWLYIRDYATQLYRFFSQNPPKVFVYSPPFRE